MKNINLLLVILVILVIVWIVNTNKNEPYHHLTSEPKKDSSVTFVA